MSLTEEQRKRLKDEAAKELGYLVMSGDYELVERLPGQAAPLVVDDATENVDGVVNAVVTIARQRAAKGLQLRAALQADDAQRIRHLAEQLTGLREDDDEASDPTSPRIN